MYDACYVEVISCGAVSGPLNGGVTTSSTDYGGTVEYFCDDGFELSGNAIRTCAASGVWSGSDPQCTGIYTCMHACMQSHAIENEATRIHVGNPPSVALAYSTH